MEQENRKPAADLENQLAELSSQIAKVSISLGRMERRLEALGEECQRTANASQRVLLRQKSLAQSVSRIESAIEAR
jgi:chromosome segregation ATPase